MIQNKFKLLEVPVSNHAIGLIHYENIYQWQSLDQVLVLVLIHQFPKSTGRRNHDGRLIRQQPLLLLD